MDCLNIVQNNNTIQINISSIDNYTNWELYSIDGKSIQQGAIDTNTFTINGVNSGTFIISIRNKNKKFSKMMKGISFHLFHQFRKDGGGGGNLG